MPLDYPIRSLDTPLGRITCFDGGHGPAVLMAHGLGGDRSHFEHIAPPIAQDHRVIGMDLPGMGDSDPHPTRITIEHHARSMLAVLDSLGIERATIVGHSAGGLAAAAAALIAPSRIERLVLINAAGLRAYPLALRMLARAVVRPPVLRAVLPFTATRILEHVFHQRNAYTRKFVIDSIERPHEPALSNIVRTFNDLAPELLLPTIRTNAHRLTMPVLVVWGARDKLVPLATVVRVVRALPNARLHVLDACGHMPIIELPEETAAAIRAFLTSDSPVRHAA